MCPAPAPPRSLRFFRLGAWLILVVIALLVVLIVVANRSGAQQWAQVKARLESEGETADFVKLLPPRVDPATNFCAIEALDGIGLQGDEKTPQGRKRQVLEELGWRKKAGLVPPIPGGRLFGQNIDLGGWAKFARDTAFIPMPPDSGNPARDLLQALDAAQPLVKALADAALAHPHAQFTPSLRDIPLASPLVGLGMPYWNGASNAQSVLGLRALAASGADDTAAATGSVLAMLRIAEALSQEPLLISLLMSMNSHEFTEEAIWSILEKRHATAAELLAIQEALGKLHFHRQALPAMRGELAVNIDVIACLQSKSANKSGLVGMFYGGSLPVGPAVFDILFELVPSGIIDGNKAVIASMELEGLIEPLKAGDYANIHRHVAAMNEELRTHSGLFHPGHAMARFMEPEMTKSIDRVYFSEATRRQAIIACALERHYLQHKTYPATLAELVPPFLATVPEDPMDDQPMRYAQTSDGRYRLWSVGFDLKDDNGKVNLGAGSPPSARVLRDHDSQGDWSWLYQPVK